MDRRSRKDNLSNIMVSLQHDVGKWCTEYTWSAEDGMWGVRVLHNFGRLGISPVLEDGPQVLDSETRPRRVDEEEATGGGLKGRVSAGAEFYFSANEKSAGGEYPSNTSYKHRTYHTYSIHWYPVHYNSGCNSTVISAVRESLIFALYGIAPRSAFSTHNNYRIIQPNDGSYVWCICSESFP
jgi:hypothetical protein